MKFEGRKQVRDIASALGVTPKTAAAIVRRAQKERCTIRAAREHVTKQTK